MKTFTQIYKYFNCHCKVNSRNSKQTKDSLHSSLLLKLYSHRFPLQSWYQSRRFCRLVATYGHSIYNLLIFPSQIYLKDPIRRSQRLFELKIYKIEEERCPQRSLKYAMVQLELVHNLDIVPCSLKLPPESLLIICHNRLPLPVLRGPE